MPKRNVDRDSSPVDPADSRRNGRFLVGRQAANNRSDATCLQVPGITLTATYWWLDVDNELRFVGDSNAVEPTGASERRGYELVAFWRPRPWLAIDGNYTASRSRYDNGDRIPNAFENAASAGIALVLNPWEASVRVRDLGPYPLIEDNSVRDTGSTVVNVRAARKIGRFEVYGEVLNILDSRDKDIAYFYESYIPSFDTAGPADGRLSRVVEPRTLRLGARVDFKTVPEDRQPRMKLAIVGLLRTYNVVA